MTRPERPPRGPTELSGGGKMIYDGDLTVLDKDGELVSWLSSDLLEMMWGEVDETEEPKKSALFAKVNATRKGQCNCAVEKTPLQR